MFSETLVEKLLYADPRIVICIPVYNEKKYIKELLESIKGQTSINYCVVISDNASDDGTSDICENFVNMEPNFRYHRHSVNRGAIYNVKWLIENTKSKYISIIGAHDVIHKDFVRIHCEYLDMHPEYIHSYSNVCWIDEDGRRTRSTNGGNFATEDTVGIRRFFASMQSGYEYTAINSVFRREAFETAGWPNVMGPDCIVMARSLFEGFSKRHDVELYYRREFKNRESTAKKRLVGDTQKKLTRFGFWASFINIYLKLPLSTFVKIWNFPKFIFLLEKSFGFGLYRAYIKATRKIAAL